MAGKARQAGREGSKAEAGKAEGRSSTFRTLQSSAWTP